jgi:hypothetical protein
MPNETHSDLRSGKVFQALCQASFKFENHHKWSQTKYLQRLAWYSGGNDDERKRADLSAGAEILALLVKLSEPVIPACL